MKRVAAAAALLLAACTQPAPQASLRPPPAPPPAAQPIDLDSYTPQQQADLRALVRDYLVRDPTVLKEALTALSQREKMQREYDIANDPLSFSTGPRDAPITIVEFFDYRCPYCHAAMDWVLDTARTRRDVRVVFKEFPVLGPQSAEAAQAAVAAMKQGRYLPFHRALMSHRGDLTPEAIDSIARRNGVDVARMRRDMQSEEVTAILSRNLQQGAEANVTGTPAFLINGEWISGFRDRETLDAALREAGRAKRQAANVGGG
jgi:protein-disulfide isomerase